MSYKDGYKRDLGVAATPAGSLAPVDSTLDGSKWHHGVDGASIARLTKISAEINTAVDDTIKTVAKSQIKVGRLLNDARALIPGDQQFGKWREQNTSITNKSTANKLMNLAKQIGDGRITQEMIDALPMSTLKELISAPDSVIEAVQAKVVEGEVVGREEVRELSREEKEPAEITGKENMPPERAAPAPKAPIAPVKPPITVNARNEAERIINLTTTARIALLDVKGKPPFSGCRPTEWAWLVFGMDIDPAILPNREVLDALHESMLNKLENGSSDEELAAGLATIDRAIQIISEEY